MASGASAPCKQGRGLRNRLLPESQLERREVRQICVQVEIEIERTGARLDLRESLPPASGDVESATEAIGSAAAPRCG